MNDRDTLGLTHLGIVGAGAMGTGIAHVFALAGMVVSIYDAREQAAQAAKEQIIARLQKRVADGKMPADKADAAAACLRVATSLQDFADCDVVVEAIVENIDVKAQVFAELEAVTKPSAILASNTSSIPIGQIAANCQHRDRIIGLHFFNPVPLMKLVEVIPGPATRPDIVSLLQDVCHRIGHTPVVVKDMPGFLVNYGGRAYPTEGLAIEHEAVATPAQIDAIMRDCFQFRMGPFELMDLTGIDVNYPVTEFIHRCFFAEPRLRSTPTHRYMLETRQLGRKTGHGFYSYDKDAAQPSADAVSSAAPCAQLVLHESNATLLELFAAVGIKVLASDDGQSPIVIAPLGEDCSAYIARHQLHAQQARVVAIDTMGSLAKRVTLMTAPGVAKDIVSALVSALSASRKVSLIKDSPGFVGQRIAAMVANLGCEMAQTGLASTTDIDHAMRLGLNYPLGPLQLCESLGVKNVYDILCRLQHLTGDDRYRPSQWLRRRAELQLSIYTSA